MVAVPGRGELTGIDSLRQTDRLAVIAEHLLGLRSGLVFANRRPANQRVRLPVVTGPAVETSVVDSDNYPLHRERTPELEEARVTLPPGACLIVRDEPGRGTAEDAGIAE